MLAPSRARRACWAEAPTCVERCSDARTGGRSLQCSRRAVLGDARVGSKPHACAESARTLARGRSSERLRRAEARVSAEPELAAGCRAEARTQASSPGSGTRRRAEARTPGDASAPRAEARCRANRNGAPKRSVRGSSPWRAHCPYSPSGRSRPAFRAWSGAVFADVERRRKPRGSGTARSAKPAAQETVCSAAPSPRPRVHPKAVARRSRAMFSHPGTASLRRPRPARGRSQPPQRCRSQPRLVIRQRTTNTAAGEPAAGTPVRRPAGHAAPQ